MATVDEDDELLTAMDIAELMGVSRSSVGRYVTQGYLPQPVRMGTRVFWTRSQYRAHIQRLLEIANDVTANRRSGDSSVPEVPYPEKDNRG